MLTHKSSQASYHPANQTLVLDIGPDWDLPPSLTPTTARLFPHRVKKLQHPDSHRKNKAIKMIEEIAEFHCNKDQAARVQSVNKKLLQKSGKISAYLSYKKEQQVIKMQHYMKLGHPEGRSCPRREGRAEVQSRSFSQSPNRPGSLNRIDMVLAPESGRPRQKERRDIVKSRQFYLKTAEGKRQRVSSLDYENRLMTRLTEAEGRNEKSQLFLGANEFAENQFIFRVNQSESSPKPQSSYNSRHMLRCRNKSNSLLRSREERATVVERRPWTSSNGDYS